jgi:hypothetical protein
MQSQAYRILDRMALGFSISICAVMRQGSESSAQMIGKGRHQSRSKALYYEVFERRKFLSASATGPKAPYERLFDNENFEVGTMLYEMLLLVITFVKLV